MQHIQLNKKYALKNNYLYLIGCTFIKVIPAILISLLFINFKFPQATAGFETNITTIGPIINFNELNSIMRILIILIFLSLYLFIINPINYGATVAHLRALAHSSATLEQFDQQSNFAYNQVENIDQSSLNKVLQEISSAKLNLFSAFTSDNYITIVIALAIRTFLISIGLLLFILPGIYFANRYSYLDYILATRKELNAIQALKASAMLSRGQVLNMISSRIGLILLHIIIAPLVIPYILWLASTWQLARSELFINSYSALLTNFDQTNNNLVEINNTANNIAYTSNQTNNQANSQATARPQEENDFYF